MEQKKDIGQLIEQRLEAMEVAPNDQVWDQIEHTLDQKRKRRQRFLLLFLLLGAGLITVIGLTYNSSKNHDPKEEISKQIPEELPNLSNGSTEVNNQPEDLEQGETITDSSEATTNSKPRLTNNGSSEKGARLDSFTEKETTYYYYRNTDNQEVITENKAVIDSLLKREDSIKKASSEKNPVKKKDSL